MLCCDSKECTSVKLQTRISADVAHFSFFFYYTALQNIRTVTWLDSVGSFTSSFLMSPCWYYGKTNEVGHPCMSVTCHIWLYFYGTREFLWHYTPSLLSNLATCVCVCVLNLGHGVTFSAMLYMQVQFADLNDCIVFMSRNPHSLPELLLALPFSVSIEKHWKNF